MPAPKPAPSPHASPYARIPRPGRPQVYRERRGGCGKGEGDVHIYSSQAREKGPTNACAQEPQPFFISQEYPVHLFPSNVLHDPQTAPIPPPPPLPNTTPRDADSHECHEEPNAAHQAHEARDPHTMRPMTSTTPTHVHRSPSRTHAELQPLPFLARAGTVHYALVCSSLCTTPETRWPLSVSRDQ